MLSSLDSSDKSSMCELHDQISLHRRGAWRAHEKRGSPCSLKYASSASSIPSNHGKSFFAQWSEWITTGLNVSPNISLSKREYAHAVGGSDGADKVGSSSGTSDGSLLLVVGETFTGKEGCTTLRDLQDDGRVDFAGSLETSVHNRRGSDVLMMSEWISKRGRDSGYSQWP